MAEKKEHHLTRAKRLREEAEARGEIIEETIESQEEVEQEVEQLQEKIAKLESRPFYVYDKKASLVAHCNSEQEANEELKKFPGGFKRMI